MGDEAVPVLVVVRDVVAVELLLVVPVLEGRVAPRVLLVGLVHEPCVLLVHLGQVVAAKRLERRLPEPLEPVEAAVAGHLVEQPREPVGEPVVVVRVGRLQQGAPVRVLEQVERPIRYVGRPVGGELGRVVA